MNEICIILVIAFIVNASGYSMRNFRVGDTVDVMSRNKRVDLIVSDIFNGFDGSTCIEKKNISNYNSDITYETCLKFESLKEKFYPKVLVDGKASLDVASNLFHHTDRWRDQYLGVNNYYINNQLYRYGVVKICRIFEKQNLNVKLIGSYDFPKALIKTNYNILFNKTTIFRLKHDDETHYVSSIYTGTCLVQIFVNFEAKCVNIEGNSPEKGANFIESSFYRTSIRSVHMDHNLEDKINDYYFKNTIDYSLFVFQNIENYHQYNILNLLENKDLVSMELISLPDLSVASRLQKIQTTSVLKKFKKLNDMIPGDLFNLEELFSDKIGVLISGNILVNGKDGETSSFSSYIYTNCRYYTGDEVPNIENGKINVFYEMLFREHFGIELKFLNEKMACLTMYSCSILKREKLFFPSTVVIKVNENSKNNKKYNIFEKKNIILWSSEGTETHFVNRTEKGECVSQTMIYPHHADAYHDRSIFDYYPIYKGKILSATRNHVLEERVKEFVNNDFRTIFGNKKNVSSIVKTFEELHRSSLINNTLIYLYLEELI